MRAEAKVEMSVVVGVEMRVVVGVEMSVVASVSEGSGEGGVEAWRLGGWELESLEHLRAPEKIHDLGTWRA